MTSIFHVPSREEVSANNQTIFDSLNKQLGFVPNLYATFALNETALADYLQLQNRKSTLKAKEREVINLVVSEVNKCDYCLAAHTTIGKMNGFSEEQILEIRQGKATFDSKLDALARFTRNITVNRSIPDAAASQTLVEAGYTTAQIVDIIIVIGDKMISNFLNGVAATPIDFPVAEPLSA
ncbi:MAG: carboxymuconolactone decarboxylase family protein [Bacteroidetes bacterium]|nr:MAG: carboxymuconolactone decarboxylase family protein [Bacteroidota bacterium]